MNISVNGQSRIPPGFRFHPTEEELLQYYLRKKVANEKIDLDVIFEVDLNKLEPWDIQEKCRIGTTPQNDWYFFSHKDKKYPTGTRTNRATVAGFWKATGRDKVIHGSGRRIGMRKTLVFYKGRAPHGQKSDWIMHEYRLDDNNISSSNLLNNDTHVTNHGMINNGEFIQEEGWVVCRIFKKKNLIKTLDNHNNTTSSFNNNNQNNHNHNSNNLISSSSMMDHQSHYSTMLDSPSDHDHDHDHDDNDQGALEQIFQTLGTHSKFPQINKIITKSTSSFNNNNNNNNNNISSTYFQQPTMQLHQNDVVSTVNDSETDINNGDWAALDRLVATHLNGHHDHTIDSMTSIFTSSSSSTNLHQHDHDHHDVDIQLPPLRSSPSDEKNYHNTPSNNNNNNNTLESYNLWSFTRASLSIDPLCHVSDGGI